MKKCLLFITTIMMMLVITYGCSQEESITTQVNGHSDVVFTFKIPNGIDIQGLITKVDDIESCKDLTELAQIAANDSLFASIVISTNSDPNVTTGQIEIDSIKINSLGGTDIQTMAYPLAAGTYYVHSVGIYKKGTADPLYYGVSPNGDFANFISDPDELMSNKSFTISEDQYFKKTPFELWVLCSTNAEAGDFGFAKWNFNLVSAHCFPFMVNYCQEDGADLTGVGYIKIEYVEQNGDTTELKNEYFACGDGPGSICYKDDQAVSDASENHIISLTLIDSNQNVIYNGVKEITTEDLKKYAEHPSFHSDFNFMHINLCDCEDTWIFDCTTDGETEVEIPESKCKTSITCYQTTQSTKYDYLEFWRYKQDEEGNFVGNGSDPNYEETDYINDGINLLGHYEYEQNGTKILPKGIACRTLDGIRYSQNTYFGIQTQVKDQTNAAVRNENVFTVILYNLDGTVAAHFKYNALVNGSSTYQTIYFKDLTNKEKYPTFQGSVTLGECYRVGIMTYIDEPYEIKLVYLICRQGSAVSS